MSARDYYEYYHLSEDGDLEASFPGTTHLYNKTEFCLIFLQVHIECTVLRDERSPTGQHDQRL